MPEEVIVVTSDYVPGRRITKVLGPVFGITVRSRGLGANIVARLRTLAGGEIKEYTQMLAQAREDAVERMREEARRMGANAVVAFRFDSSEIGEIMTEIVAYGTAVVVEDAGGEAQRIYLS